MLEAVSLSLVTVSTKNSLQVEAKENIYSPYIFRMKSVSSKTTAFTTNNTDRLNNEFYFDVKNVKRSQNIITQ